MQNQYPAFAYTCLLYLATANDTFTMLGNLSVRSAGVTTNGALAYSGFNPVSATTPVFLTYNPNKLTSLVMSGVDGNDTFNILAPNVGATLIAGSGNDTFTIADGASITTPINGGGGTNTIDFSSATAAMMATM